MVTVAGSNLSMTTRNWADADFQGGLLPTELDGVRIRVNGVPAGVAFVSPGQLNGLAQMDPTLTEVEVVVETPWGVSDPAIVFKRPTEPEFFRFNPEQGRYVAAVHLDGVLVGKLDLCFGLLKRGPRNRETSLPLMEPGSAPPTRRPPPIGWSKLPPYWQARLCFGSAASTRGFCLRASLSQGSTSSTSRCPIFLTATTYLKLFKTAKRSRRPSTSPSGTSSLHETGLPQPHSRRSAWTWP